MTWQLDNRIALENDRPRADIVEKVTGRAKFTTDIYPDKLLWAGYVRCPYGKARLLSHEADKARAIEGVLDVVVDRREGTYPGDRLGHVCAVSAEALEAAFVALNPKFEIDRPRAEIDKARTPFEKVDPGKDSPAVEKALSAAELVVEAYYGTEVQTHSPLEPHVGQVDYRGDRAVAWGSTQGTFGFRDDVAEVLGLGPEKVEFHCEYIGGGFGGKLAGGGPEGQLAAKMSLKYGRPCRVVLSRREEFLDAGMRPGSRQYMKVAVSRDGRISAARVHTWGSVGPTGGGGGVRNPSRYAFGQVAKTHEDVHLNSGYPRPMRAPGHPQGMFAVELMMDALAEKVKMDRLTFRKLNDPNTTRRKMYDVGAELIGWNRARPASTGNRSVKRGLGVGAGDWHNGQGRATIHVEIHRTGAVEVFSGSQDIGTGFRTVLRDVVAHQLGVPAAAVTAHVGRSDYPPGPASGGSVTSRMTAPRAFAAAEDARRQLTQLVAREWKVDPDRPAIRNGVFVAGERSMSWREACRLIPDDRLTARAADVDGFWTQPTGSEGVQFAEVEVDTETGIVRVIKIVALQEMGQPVNRLTAENQIIGAVTQGLSFALFENRILDRQTGAMVNPNFDQYRIAGPVDIPEIIPVFWKERDDASVNSLGEPPVIPTAGAIATAVADAIGVQVRNLPLTPARVLAALAGKDETGA